jgi:hypothetical protein
MESESEADLVPPVPPHPLIWQLPLTDRNRLAKAVFTEDRGCTAWAPYQPGRNSEAHLRVAEMLEIEKMKQQAQRDSQQIQKDSLAIAESLKQTQADHLDFVRLTTTSAGRLTLWIVALNVFMVLLTIAIVVLTMVLVVRG